jgi:hypothetical protein
MRTTVEPPLFRSTFWQQGLTWLAITGELKEAGVKGSRGGKLKAVQGEKDLRANL